MSENTNQKIFDNDKKMNLKITKSSWKVKKLLKKLRKNTKNNEIAKYFR